MTQSSLKEANFNGLAVAAFESRRAEEIATLISRFGGVPHVAPSMREAPLEDDSAARKFAEMLPSGLVDIAIFMTGVGTTLLIQTLAKWLAREEVIQRLSSARVVARGWKTIRALEEQGIRIDIKVPEPNTWREIISTLGSMRPSIVSNARIVLQEYGEPNDRLVQELKAQGAAEILRVPVYRWALPENLGPMENVIDEIVNGRARVVLFTNAVQVAHVMQFAQERGLRAELRKALERCVVCSVGPTCSEALAAHHVSVDFEPESHKMGIFVHDAAKRAPDLLRQKDLDGHIAVTPVSPPPRESQPAWRDSRFMKACRMEPVDATPVWLMRQAGRYMKEYRDLRERVPFLELCKNPDLAAEVTISAAQRIDADAAILFADLLLPAEPMGFHLDYERGGGPRLNPVVRRAEDVERLYRASSPRNCRDNILDSLAYVFEAIRRSRANLNPGLPLIGFAGAPFTLASYLIEGGASKTFRHTKTLMFRDPKAFHRLMDYLALNTSCYINEQIAAGAQAVQIFDSWVGCLAPSGYKEFVLPHMRRLFRSLTPSVPVIHFGTGTGSLLELMRKAGGSIMGIDFRVDLDKSWKKVGTKFGLQGNLDPTVLFTDLPTIREHAIRILRQASGRPGHIFNLGHGILPETPLENVVGLVRIVHEESRRLKENKETTTEDE